jgi:hypothetical protein
MNRQIHKIVSRLHAAESGQAIIMVLILLVIGSLVLVPSLSLSLAAIRSNETYAAHTNELYTADSGIEDGIWRIKYDYFGPSYDPYDYTTVYSYQTDELNGLAADITIQNIWVPSNVTLSGLGLTSDDARDIIEDERLVVTGSAGAIPGEPYDIKIDYDPVDVSENLTVKSVGVWLPQGFTYTTSSGTLENLDFGDDAYAEPTVTSVPGGTSIVWSYGYPYPLFTAFPGVSTEDDPMSMELSFSYSPPEDDEDAMPTAIAWITTELEDGSESDYPVSWDVDTRIFKLTSAAGDTIIQAYSSKAELRQMGDAMTGEYIAIGNSLMLDNYSPYDKRDTLLTDSTTSITSVPEDGDALLAYLYWTGWLSDAHIINVFSDSCGDITADWTRAASSDWSQGSGEYVGENTGGSADADYLTLNTIDLSSYVPGSVLITWDQDSEGGAIYLETCDNFTDWSAGGAWWADGQFNANDNDGGSEPYLTMTASIDLSAYADDSLTLSMDLWEDDYNLGYSEGLDYAFSSDNGTSWSDYDAVFRNDLSGGSETETLDIPSEYRTNGFRLSLKVIGFSGYYTLSVDDIRINIPLSSSDGLDFAISGDNGASWSDSIEAFRDDVTSSTESYQYYLPTAYTTGQFMFRFDTVGLDEGQSVSVDNFRIRDLPPDTDVVFQIDGEQVHFDANGDPHSGSDPVEADSSAVLLAPESLGGYFYRSKTDVSKLVKTFPVDEGEEHHTGNADYTVGDVDGSTGNYLSHCGWSMILIYASPTTAGHYLYLRDFFADNPGSTNLDFDGDGTAGGDITNFVVPEPIRNKQGDIIESTAARITSFVGEGDSNYSGDTLEITGQQSGASLYLSNSASPWNNVWNGASPGMSYPGIDVDTFEIDWDDGILQPGDTTLHLDMDSGTDAWTFIYLIMSVRSETLTSGTTHYVINRG